MHLGKGDDFVVAEHAERVIKAGSADLGGEPLSPCCAEQGPAKFQLPLPVDHGQAEPTAPTRVPSERRWAIHFPTRSACHCRAISRPRLPTVSATRHRTSRRRRGRCAPGKDRSRALDRHCPIPTEAFRSSSAHHTRSSVGLRSVGGFALSAIQWASTEPGIQIAKVERAGGALQADRLAACQAFPSP